jgi:Putative zinc-finger/HEAT repeats
MTCDSVSKLIPLYFYGELNPDEEERVEEHLHDCAECARSLERQRSLGVALDRRQVEAPQFLLEDCRADLMAAIQGGAPRVDRSVKGPWTLFLEALGSTFVGFHRFRQPLGAVALVALGFVAARFTGKPPAQPLASGAPSDEVFATVRDVKPDSAGRVQINYDETRRRTVTGSTDDQGIQRLLLAAAHEEDPAVRVESVGLLRSRANSSEVRDAFINRVLHDPNVGVRLRAMEGLKLLAGDPEVRKTLAHVLVTDDSAAVRSQVVDVLLTHHDDAMVGVLQNAVQKEDNTSVRLKVEKALKDMNASIGTF